MQEDDVRWLIKNKKALFKKYGRCCLAIKNEQVIGTYDSFMEAYNATLKTEKPGTFILQEIDSGKAPRKKSIYINNITLG